MARRLTDRTTSRLCLAVGGAFAAFLTVNSFVSQTADSSSITVPAAVETTPEQTARLASEQLSKDWEVAQKRSEARRTEGVDSNPKTSPQAREP
jgi:hypothetical protein